MSFLIKSGKALLMCYAFTVFLTFFIIIFPLVFVASFFGRMKGGNMIYWLCQRWADIVLPLDFIYHRNIYETPHDRTKPSVFIFNHNSYLDIPIIMKCIRGQKFRILGKAEMARIPLFGLLYRNAVVMVERDSAASRARSVIRLKSILKKNYSVVISPEGTFNITGKPLKSFYDGAFRIAIETQTPIKPLLFLDCYKRLSPHNFFDVTPGRCRVVYLAEIPVEGYTLADVSRLKYEVHEIMEAALVRYNAAWIGEPVKA